MKNHPPCWIDFTLDMQHRRVKMKKQGSGPLSQIHLGHFVTKLNIIWAWEGAKETRSKCHRDFHHSGNQHTLLIADVFPAYPTGSAKLPQANKNHAVWVPGAHHVLPAPRVQLCCFPTSQG